MLVIVYVGSVFVEIVQTLCRSHGLKLISDRLLNLVDL